MFLAVQNNVILDTFDNYADALERIQEEKNRDTISLMLKKSLLKKLQKNGSNIALHSYKIFEVEEVHTK